VYVHKLQVLKDTNLKITILRVVMAGSMVQGETFGASCCLHYQNILKILKARLVKFPHTYQTTRDNTRKIIVLTHC